MGTARALVGGWGSWPACKARVSKPWGICVVSVSLMSSRLLSDVVHRGLAGPCRRVGDGSRAEDGASAGAHLAPYGRDQGLRLVAAGHSPLASCLSLIHISEPTRLGMISYAVF